MLRTSSSIAFLRSSLSQNNLIESVSVREVHRLNAKTLDVNGYLTRFHSLERDRVPSVIMNYLNVIPMPVNAFLLYTQLL